LRMWIFYKVFKQKTSFSPSCCPLFITCLPLSLPSPQGRVSVVRLTGEAFADIQAEPLSSPSGTLVSPPIRRTAARSPRARNQCARSSPRTQNSNYAVLIPCARPVGKVVKWTYLNFPFSIFHSQLTAPLVSPFT